MTSKPVAELKIRDKATKLLNQVARSAFDSNYQLTLILNSSETIGWVPTTKIGPGSYRSNTIKHLE
jgi:hypothetical protein